MEMVKDVAFLASLGAALVAGVASILMVWHAQFFEGFGFALAFAFCISAAFRLAVSAAIDGGDL